MPYIENREPFEKDIASLTKKIKTSGELNYVFTKLLLGQKPKCYEDYNRLIGVIESCKLEFYRRKVVNYELEKCELNGDVY